MRRVVAVVAVVVGVVLIGFTFSEHLFSRSRDAQTIADHYQPLMSTAGLASLRHGFDQVQAAGAQLDHEALPQLQARLGMTPAEFDALVSRTMPGIAAFNAQAPAVVAYVGPVIGQMEAERGDYHQASQIPTGWLGLDSAPWLFLGIGLGLVVVGGWAWFRPTRLAVGLLTLAGVGLVVAPLVLGIPGKVDAAVRVTKLGAVGLAPSTGKKAVGATALFDGMARDVSTKLAPAVAAAPGGSAPFAAQYPTLAGWAHTWETSISTQSHALSDSQVRLAPTFASANRIPLHPIPWLFIGSGALLAVLGAGTLLLDARRSAAARPAPAAAPVEVAGPQPS